MVHIISTTSDQPSLSYAHFTQF